MQQQQPKISQKAVAVCHMGWTAGSAGGGGPDLGVATGLSESQEGQQQVFLLFGLQAAAGCRASRVLLYAGHGELVLIQNPTCPLITPLHHSPKTPFKSCSFN